MNIEKVNAILSKALVHIQEGEAQSLRALVLSDVQEDEEPTKFETVVGLLADKVVAESNIADDVAIDAIIEVAGSMAESGELPELFGLDSPTDEQVEAWLKAVENSKLIEQTLRHLASA